MKECFHLQQATHQPAATTPEGPPQWYRMGGSTIQWTHQEWKRMETTTLFPHTPDPEWGSRE